MAFQTATGCCNFDSSKKRKYDCDDCAAQHPSTAHPSTARVPVPQKAAADEPLHPEQLLVTLHGEMCRRAAAIARAHGVAWDRVVAAVESASLLLTISNSNVRDHIDSAVDVVMQQLLGAAPLYQMSLDSLHKAVCTQCGDSFSKLTLGLALQVLKRKEMVFLNNGMWTLRNVLLE